MKSKYAVIGLVILICLAATLLRLRRGESQSTRSDQEQSGKISIAGLHQEVTIGRDRRGVPYIRASDEHDAYFAQGYATASDRLWQMDLLRRTARGELSEILGTSSLEEDKRRRAYGFAALAEEVVSRSSEPVRSELEAHAKGVNAYIESLNQDNLPLEFRLLQYKPRLWTPADSAILGKLLAETLSTTWHIDMMRALFSGLPQQRQTALMPTISPLDLVMVGSDKVTRSTATRGRRATFGGQMAAEAMTKAAAQLKLMEDSLRRVGLNTEGLGASNNWVVSGQHSATDKPLLANDPHLSPSAPSLWYMVNLTAPGLHVAGVTIPGVPGVIIGHNDSISWGVTNVEAEVQDLYIEKFDKADPRLYLTPAGLREAQIRKEEIKTRKRVADPAVERVESDVVVTRHGPIILEQDGIRYALAWPALDATSNELEAHYYINRANTWPEFCAALKRYTGFPLNFIYADTNGHIGYWAAGRYPIRKTGNGATPYDGAKSDGDWTGYIEFEQTPHVYDPSSGIIVTANNRIVGSSYPHYISQSWIAPYRARRIYELLTAKAKLTVEDFREIQADTYSYADSLFIAEVLNLGRPLAAGSQGWREIVAFFNGWNARLNESSDKMPLALAMRAAFQRRLISNAVGESLVMKYKWPGAGTFFDWVITTRPADWLPPEFHTYEEFLLECYKDAVRNVTSRLGPDRSKWTWGSWGQIRFPHALAIFPNAGPLLIAPFPQNGGLQAINKGEQVSMRMIVDLSNWDNTRQGIPLGQSGNPASANWTDQLESWRTVTPPAFPFSKSAVDQATNRLLLLAPLERDQAKPQAGAKATNTDR